MTPAAPARDPGGRRSAIRSPQISRSSGLNQPVDCVLECPLFFQMGIKGNAATLSGGNQGAGNYSLGLQLDYLSKYTFAVNYSDFLGKYRDNGSIVTVGNGPLYRDRGLLSLSFRTSF